MIAVLTPVIIALGALGLVVAALVVFVETGVVFASFLPGDGLLFTMGILVADHQMPLPLVVVGAALALAAVLGDQAGFLLGRRFGPRVFSRQGSRLLNPDHVSRAEVFYARHGQKTVVLARFVPVVRGFAPPIAGVARMSRRRFTTYNVLGAVAWTAVMLVAGYYAGGIPLVAHHVELFAIALVALSLLPATLAWARERTRRASR